MITPFEQMPFELKEITFYEYELSPAATCKVYPFSATETFDAGARFVRDSLPGAMTSILPRYRENARLLRGCLGMSPTPDNETRCLAQINTSLPSRGAEPTNLAVGRHYDVYRVASFVVKIERYYGVVIFPAFQLRTRQWPDFEARLTSAQLALYQGLRTLNNARKAIFRSITTQDFYSKVVRARLQEDACVATAFALLEVNGLLLDVQVQPYRNGPSLESMLGRQGFFKRLAGDAPYSLKTEYTHLRAGLKESVGKLLALSNIDHHPPNFILDQGRNILTLVDIQEFAPEYDAPNRALLERVWRSW